MAFETTQQIAVSSLPEKDNLGSNSNFQAFVETIEDVIVVGNLQGVILYANPAAIAKLGYSLAELRRMHVIDLNAQTDRSEAEQIFAELLSRKRNTCPLPLQRKDGSYLSVETRVWFGLWNGENCIFGISKDVSKQQSAFDRFRVIFNNNPALMAISSLEEGRFIDVNAAFLKKLGYEREEIIGKTSVELNLFPNMTHRNQAAIDLKKNGNIKDLEVDIRTKSQEIINGIFSGEIIETETEKSLLTVMMDVSAQKKTERMMAKQGGLLQSLLDSLTDLIFFKDGQGHFLGCNHPFADFVGKTTAEILGKTAFDLYEPERAEVFTETDNQVLKTRKPHHIEGWQKYANGRLIYASTIKSPYFDTNGRLIGLIGICRDITESKIRETEMEYLTFHDRLTGLFNLRFYEEELHRLDNSRNYPLSIILCDVNGLKFVNDSFGHAQGDELLKTVAESLKKGCSSEDVIARIGGDEFVIILPKADFEIAKKVIHRIEGILSQSCVDVLEVTAAFGAATKTDPLHSLMLVVKDAEDHMYQKKLEDRVNVRQKAIENILASLKKKCPQESEHGRNVGIICEKMAKFLDFSPENTLQIKLAGQMHDVGKYSWDQSLFDSTAPLGEIDWDTIKKHPDTGFRVLSTVYELSKTASYVLEHHERWDGKGYPKGLKENQISLPARIISIAEAYDVMISDHPYQKAISQTAALFEIQKGSGTQFDPEIVRLFLEHAAEF